MLILLVPMQPPPVPANLPGWVQQLLAKLPDWAERLILALVPLGGWGLFVIAFLDSSFLTFPIINDALVVALSMLVPEQWLFYATMTAAGSILGCVVIYSISRKGGAVALRRRARPEQIERISRWYEKYEFLTVTIPAVLPPPTPFKIFVLSAGVFQVRLRHFLTAIILGRGLRYYLEGFLAANYGEPMIAYVRQNLWQVTLMAAGLLAAGFLIFRLVGRAGARSVQTPAS